MFLCHHDTKAAIDNINEWVQLCSNKTLYTETDERPDMANVLHGQVASGLDHFSYFFF
jgi:hypothetical protein